MIIHLDSTIVPAIGIRHSEHIGNHTPPSLFTKPADKEPAAGFDPVRFYLRELREAYRQFALFFHDPCGGDRIAVLWRPEALEEKPFTVWLHDVHNQPDLFRSNNRLHTFFHRCPTLMEEC